MSDEKCLETLLCHVMSSFSKVCKTHTCQYIAYLINTQESKMYSNSAIWWWRVVYDPFRTQQKGDCISAGQRTTSRRCLKNRQVQKLHQRKSCPVSILCYTMTRLIEFQWHCRKLDTMCNSIRDKSETCWGPHQTWLRKIQETQKATSCCFSISTKPAASRWALITIIAS